MKKGFLCCLMILSTIGMAAAANRTYTVKKGDSLSKIASTTLGSAQRWREIAKLNGIRKPYLIRPGQVLTLSGAAAVNTDGSSEPTAYPGGDRPISATRGLEDQMEATKSTVPTAYPTPKQPIPNDRGVTNPPQTSYPTPNGR